MRLRLDISLKNWTIVTVMLYLGEFESQVATPIANKSLVPMGNQRL